MIWNMTSDLITSLLGIFSILILVILPALIELKIPRDSGPWMILKEEPPLLVFWGSFEIPILDIDGEYPRLELIKKLTEVLSILPELEM